MSKLHLLLAVLLSTLALACSAGNDRVHAAEPATVTAPADAAVLRAGSFEGRNDHVVTGTVEIIEADGATYLRLGADFSLDGAPDPKVGFGTAGTYDESTTLAALANDTGEQTYLLPAGFDVSAHGEAYIWCEDFSVALGVASLR